MDLLIETSEIPNANTLPTQQIQQTATEYAEKAEPSYIIIGGCGETSTDVITEPTENSLTLQTKAYPPQRPTEGHLRLLDQPDCHVSLQTEIHQSEAPKSNKTSKAATNSISCSSSTNAISPLPLALHQSTQQGQRSLQDSALSHLIDAVSLGKEYDTCGSISALIGQFEVTAEQSNLNLSSGSRSTRLSVQPMHNQLFSTPQKTIQDLSQKAQQPVEKDLPCSPETTESTVFTILDEQVLSPVSVYNIPDQTICKKMECESLGGNKSSPLTKIPFGGRREDNNGWQSHGDKSYKPHCQSLALSRSWGYGCYKDTSINSTASERFLACHDSASSSLMEVEVNVDGEPLDTTLTLDPSSNHESLQNSLYFTQSISTQSYKLTESSTHQLDCPINQPHKELFNRSNATISEHFKPGRYNGVTYNNRHFETRDKNGMICKAQHFQNGFSSSECLLRTRDINSQPQNDSYMPGSDCDMIYSPVEYRDPFVPSKQYSNSLQQNQALDPTHSEIYKGIYLVGSPVPTAPSPCKSKSLGDLTSEDISCNFQSKYKVISRSFITPAMRDQKRMWARTDQQQSSDSLTEQLRKLVTLDEVEPYSNASRLQPTPKSLSVFPPVSLNSVVSTQDSHDPPAFLSRKLSSRSQSRVRHIASRARERQQEALKPRPAGGIPDVVLRNKAGSSRHPLINRHSTGSYIAGYLEQVGVEDRGLPEGSCKTLCYGYHDQGHTDDSLIPHNSCSSSEPEVYFLLRL